MALIEKIVDDTHTDFTFGPTDWIINTDDPWFNGTGHVPPTQSNGQLFMTFNGGPFCQIPRSSESNSDTGTLVKFFGITPPAYSSQIFSVSIDGSEPTTSSYNDPNPPSYRQWYQSPTLSEGLHNISLTKLNGTSLDFAVVTAGNDTPLTGQVAIVDNQNPLITFQGNWKQNSSSFISSQIPDGLPFRNTTQDSTTIGDSLTFRFTGTLSYQPLYCNCGGINFWLGQSAATFGVYDWSIPGLITLTFTLDGSSLTKTFQVTSTTAQFISQTGQEPNFEFFSYDFLTPGNHTLVVNVTDLVNQTFSFDYITFQPSFSTLANMPNLTSLTGPGSNSHSSHGFPTGAIVGIIIAAIAIVICAVFGSRRWKQRRLSKDNLGKSAFLTVPCLELNHWHKPFIVGVNPFLPTTSTGSFPLNTRVVSPALSNGTTAITSNNYTAVRVADPDAPGGLNTASNSTPRRENDAAEDVPPSYDESNRMTVVL